MPRARRLISDAVRASRPHLWTYTLGAACLGALAAGGVAALRAPVFVWFGLWLTAPAGWAIYALNDAFDGEADGANPRKRGLERPLAFRRALALPALGAVSFLPLALFLPTPASAAVAVAVVATYLYSAPPLRAKGVPVLDGALYLAPVALGAAGYAAASGAWPPLPALAVAWGFSFAMHLYSAAIDVEADRAAGIRTVAVWLGAPGRSVLAAALLCAAVAALALALGGASWALAALAYAAFFAGHVAASPRLGFSPRRWYGAFAALHFAVGVALTAAYF